MRSSVMIAAVALLCGLVLLAASDARASTPQPNTTATDRPVVVVKRGQTLWSIARAYGVTVEAIVKANGLRDPDRIHVGQRLIIPLSGGTPRRPAAPRQQVKTQAKSGLSWPVLGQLLSPFGWRGGRYHDGIDIGAPYGTPIYAARAGHVTFAGWYYDYGQTVIIDHGDGLTSLYGHASALLVKTGEPVRRGQAIARVGCSGRCSGAHVHFEIRVHGRAVDPLAHLSPQSTATASPKNSSPRTSKAPSGQASDLKAISSVVVNGGTITRITDTFQDGNLVKRDEETVIPHDGRQLRIVREYRPVDGVLTLVSEQITLEEVNGN